MEDKASAYDHAVENYTKISLENIMFIMKMHV